MIRQTTMIRQRWKPVVVAVLLSSRSYALVSVPPLSREIFSVAPMVSHTNRHYHYFFGLLSRHAHLYTEMIHANHIIHLFDSEIDTPGIIATDEQIMETINKPTRQKGIQTIHELLRISTSTTTASPLILQLGGNDPERLAQAAAIGAAMGYDAINLNCGCPSNAVAGERGSGAAHMKDPSHVAYCLERISERITSIANMNGCKKVQLSVKHRLGVAEASGYDADADRKMDDTVAFTTCRQFVKAITANTDVTKLLVHARLGLLGDFGAMDGTSETTLWVPGQVTDTNGKVDHKREQYQAKKRARSQTIQNRSVPPLRPNVVNMLAEDMKHLEFVTNGGISSMETINARLHGQPSNLVGAMIGRAVINHPCSFAEVDRLWGETPTSRTRGAVLEDFIGYCKREEERVKALGATDGDILNLRQRLVAVPFQLFAGEDGSNQYQRRIRKLIHRPDRYSSHVILMAALSEVPTISRELPVTMYVPISAIQDFDFVHRSGPFQRRIK